MPPTMKMAHCVARSRVTAIRHSSTATAHLPRIAQPSLWSSLIPKSFRRPQQDHATQPTPKGRFRAWLRNPATSLVILGMLTGSQAIQVKQLRNSIEERRQIANRRVEQLREVIQRVQNGESVDLRKELGTGDPEAEAEWKEVVDQIAQEEFWMLPKEKKGRKEKIAHGMVEEDGRDAEQREGMVKSSWWSSGFSWMKRQNPGQTVVEAPAAKEVEEQPRRRTFY